MADISDAGEALPPSLAVKPNIPWESQTVEQLKAETEYWEGKVKSAPGFASAYAAEEFRQSCEVWYNKRLVEQNGTK